MQHCDSKVDSTITTLPDDLIAYLIIKLLPCTQKVLSSYSLKDLCLSSHGVYRKGDDKIHKSAKQEIYSMFALLQCCKKFHSQFLSMGIRYRQFWHEINKQSGLSIFFKYRFMYFFVSDFTAGEKQSAMEEENFSHKLWRLLYITYCETCLFKDPAPIRRGFRVRMCSWCFENCTIPRRTVLHCFNHLDKYLKTLRKDLRDIFDDDGEEELRPVYMLQDIRELFEEKLLENHSMSHKRTHST